MKVYYIFLLEPKPELKTYIKYYNIISAIFGVISKLSCVMSISLKHT